MILLEEFKKQIELLQACISNGIMDALEGESKIYMQKEKAVDNKHKYAICKRTDGRFVTKVLLDGKKKQISACSREKLIEKLYEFYYGESNSTLESLYPLWIVYRREELGTIEKTIKEDTYLWKAHLKDTDIIRKPIRNLKQKDFKLFFRELTKNRTITKKRFNNLKSVVNNIYAFAIEKEIVEFNPLIGMDFGQFKFKSENKKKTTYTSDERNQIMEFVGEDDLYDLGIKLDFCLPLRIGELKGLRFDDVEGDSIQICRFVDDKHKVVDDIKGHASAGKRFIPLIPEAKRIISRIRELNPDSEYLFMVDLEEKTFLTTVTFNRRLKKYCNALGIKYRSSHDLRFSVASILFKNGVTVPEIQEIIGHTTDSMTHHYLKNITSMDKTYEKMATIFA